jgi:hypothetical protein
MIHPQYTYDNTGNKVGVFLAIEDWNELQQIPGVEKEIAQINFDVPEWQMGLGKKELQNIAVGNADLMPWEHSRKQFKL